MSEAPSATDAPGPQALAGFEAQRAAALGMAGSVRTALEGLLAPVDLRIYAHLEFADTVRARIRQHRRLRVRLLVPEGLTRQPRGGPLWRLLQDLPSFTALRVLHEPLPDGEPVWLIADRAQVLYRRYPASANGEYDAADPRRVRTLRERFEALWTQALPDVELRRLAL